MKLNLETSTIKGVPINEYYQEDIEYKGLVFIQHGYTSNKDYGADYLALTLARKGFFVVSIDAYMHGDRLEGPYAEKDEKNMLLYSPIVIRHTAIDIIRLHKHRYIDRFPKYDLIGVSMGAMISYYVATKTDKLKKLIPVIGTPDYMYQARYNLDLSGLNHKEFLTEENTRYLERLSPINNVSKMKYEQLYILNGTEDHVVPIESTLRFIDNCEIDNYEFKTYNSGHEVHRAMQLDIFNFIEK